MTDHETAESVGERKAHDQWPEVSRLIMYRLDELTKATKENTDALQQLKTAVAVTQAKSGVFGLIGGACSFFVAWGISFLKGGGKP
jgi:hypothetical protein